MMTRPELMAPAGDWTMLTAAVNSGADAVYFGLDKLNMRAKARNFTIDELPAIVAFCKERDVKSYLTLNTIIMQDELPGAKEIISAAKRADIDMIICWDFSVIELCGNIGIPFCVSTQASVSNSASANFYKKLGAKRIVTARECSLEEIRKIRESTDIEIEAFVHGAMCIAVSGRCFMSHHVFGKSANRGECIQPCRREYEIYDKDSGKSMLIGEDYVLSPRDLCSIEFIDKLIETGINSFKIEGRKRSPEYVAKVVSVYRRAIDLYFEQNLTADIKKEMLVELASVYNRGFSAGFYFDVPSSEEYAGIYGSIATTRKEYIGKVINYFKKLNVVHIRMMSGNFKAGDKLLIIGPNTGVVEVAPSQLIKEEKEIGSAVKGDDITFICGDVVRERDLVYKVNAV